MTDRTELRRLLDEATPRPWHAWNRGIGYEVHTEVEHNPIRCDPAHCDRWGDYAEAIARHERAFGRPAPDPTEPGPKGNPRLSARFVEWMMMLPAGWVTDVPGVTRNQALKALGNGVVPPQAAAALRLMLDRMTLT